MTSKSTTASRFANFNDTVIFVFSFGESQEAIKLFNMKKPHDNKKLKLPDYDTNIQPMQKDEYEVPALENESIQGDEWKLNCMKGKKRNGWQKLSELLVLRK